MLNTALSHRSDDIKGCYSIILTADHFTSNDQFTKNPQFSIRLSMLAVDPENAIVALAYFSSKHLQTGNLD